MATEQNENIKLDAEPGKDAAGNQQAVQVAQAVGDAVQPLGTKSFPGGTPEEDSKVNPKTAKLLEKSLARKPWHTGR